MVYPINRLFNKMSRKVITADIDQFDIIDDLNIVSYKKSWSIISTIYIAVREGFEMYTPKEVFNMSQLKKINWYQHTAAGIGNKIINLKNISQIIIQEVILDILPPNLIKLPKLSSYLLEFRLSHFSCNNMTIYRSICKSDNSRQELLTFIYSNNFI